MSKGNKRASANSVITTILQDAENTHNERKENERLLIERKSALVKELNVSNEIEYETLLKVKSEIDEINSSITDFENEIAEMTKYVELKKKERDYYLSGEWVNVSLDNPLNYYDKDKLIKPKDISQDDEEIESKQWRDNQIAQLDNEQKKAEMLWKDAELINNLSDTNSFLGKRIYNFIVVSERGLDWVSLQCRICGRVTDVSRGFIKNMPWNFCSSTDCSNHQMREMKSINE